jgi:hypothetical protein
MTTAAVPAGTTTTVTADSQRQQPEVMLAVMYLPGGLFVHLVLGQHDGRSG